MGRNESENKRFYRFMSNDQVQVQELIDYGCRPTAGVLAGTHQLIIGDSSSARLSSAVGRMLPTQQVGVLEDNRTKGVRFHVSLGVNAATGQLSGLFDLLLWHRAARREGRTSKAQGLPYEQRESYKWALSARHAYARARAADQVTFIFDSDADGYEVMAAVLALGKADLLVRACRDRLIEYQAQRLKLSQALAQQDWQLRRRVPIRALNHYSKTHGKRIKRTARKAQLQIRYLPIGLLPPTQHAQAPVRRQRPLYVVEALEHPDTVPPGEEPIHWRLFTTHVVHTDEQALWIITLYQKRWLIEQLFRVRKQQGLQLEDTQLGSVDAIHRQLVLALRASCQILQLTMARDQDQGQALSAVFTPEDLRVLHVLNAELQGKTLKQQNPHPPDQLSWGSWIIARLGGWSGYPSQRAPGPITFARGLERFGQAAFAMQLLWKNQNVSKP